MKENKIICSHCGAVLTEDTATIFGGQAMCETCLGIWTSVCEECGIRIWNDSAEGDDNHILCSHCYDYYYTHCERCGRLIHNDDANYVYDDDDTPYCLSCFQEQEINPIKSYNYKPAPTFYGSGDLYMGVELELDKGGDNHDNAELILNVANKDELRLYAKHDGSIDYGFELVSHPMTLDYHLNNMSWKAVFERALDLGYRSHETHTCGLHVHVNRSAFGEDYETQEEAIGRVVYFVENHWNELLKFSRRTEASINRWASRYGISTTAKDTYKNAKDRGLGRYVAVNLTNRNTIEFRIFRGTLNYKTFVATLRLVEEICRCAINMTDKQMESMSWCDFVSRIQPNKAELIEYLKIRRLYVNEPVMEGVELL